MEDIVTLNIDDMIRWAGDPHTNEGEPPCHPECEACANWDAFSRLVRWQDHLEGRIANMVRNHNPEDLESLDYGGLLSPMPKYTRI